MNLIPKPLRQYAQFSGRMSRSRYLRWLILIIGLCLFASWLDLQVVTPALGYIPNEDVKINYVLIITALLLVIPWLSSSFRRLHDINFSGWWMLFILPVMVAFYYQNEIGFYIYSYLASGVLDPEMLMKIPFPLIFWSPIIIAYLPLIVLHLRKGDKVENSFGPPA